MKHNKNFYENTTLDELLQVLGCKKPFTKSGKFTQKGSETYNKLISILEISFRICGFENDELITLNKLVTKLDEIEYK